MNRTFKVVGAGIAVAAAAMVPNVSPASAAGGGVSMGETSIDERPGGTPRCAEARSGAIITLHNDGTFQVGTSVPFVGATKATFTASRGFFFNPAGTFADGSCTMPLVVPGGLQVVEETSLLPGAPANVGDVSCSGTGGYSRQASNVYVVTTAVGASTCSVNGSPQTSTVLTFTGNQNPCLADFPVPDPCTVPNTELVGVYTQAP